MGVFSVFCGAMEGVVTALEVRRKVCVAPLGLRALKGVVLARGGSLNHAPWAVSWWHSAKERGVATE